MLCCWGQTRPFLPLRLCLGHYFQLCAQIRWRSCTSTLFFHRHGIHKFKTSKQGSNEIQVNWTPKGHVFPTGAWPSWAVENMWAPEIHFVNGTFVVYFTGWYNHRPDQLHVWLQGEACYYGRSTEFTLELRFQPQDHPGDLTQILEAHLLCLLNDHWWLFSSKNFTLRFPSGRGAPQLDRRNRPTLFQVQEDPSSKKISLMLIFLLLLLIFISYLMV